MWNNKVKIKINADESYDIPIYATSGSAGADLCAARGITIKPGNRSVIKTGLYVQIPDGYQLEIRPRSGLAVKHGVTVLNSPGTIDSDYRGEIGVILINHGKEPFRVRVGDKIAQCVLTKFYKANWALVPKEKLTKTKRNDGAYGSKIKDFFDWLFGRKIPKIDDADVINPEESVEVEVEVEVEEIIETEPWNGKPTVSIDFDGVIHSYTSGWLGYDEIPDPPVSYTTKRAKILYSSIDWLTELVNSDRVNVAIFSSRNKYKTGIRAMKAWLLDNGMSDEILMRISFPTDKPASHVLIDDRAVQFKGNFMTIGQILKFKPWKSDG